MRNIDFKCIDTEKLPRPVRTGEINVGVTSECTEKKILMTSIVECHWRIQNPQLEGAILPSLTLPYPSLSLPLPFPLSPPSPKK